MSPVNSKQAEKARQTRARVLTAAEELFTERGYGATTLQEIADRAGVAVQTIYFVFRNKRTLLKELADVAVAGDDEPVPTMRRPWFTAAMAAPTAEEHLRAHVAGAASVDARVSALYDVIRTAAALEPEIDELRRAGDGQRYEVQLAAARALTAKPGARPGVTAEHAADVLYATVSPEMYLLLVRDRRWSADRFADWARETLRAQLIEDAAGNRPRLPG